jgi:type II secretion system protein L
VARSMPNGFAWVDRGEAGPLIGAGTRDALRTAFGDRPWVALYPAEKTLLTHVGVSARRRRDASRSARYAIEETLAGDVEQAHVALASDPVAGCWPAAVTDASELGAYLQAFGEPADWPTFVVPEVLALPWREGEWTLACDDDRVVLRLGRWSGLALPREALDAYLALLLGEGMEPASVVHVTSPEPSVGEATGQVLARRGLEARVVPPEPFLVSCAETLATAIVLDMRVGPFARVSRGPRIASVAVLVASVVVASLAVCGTSLLELRAAQRERAALAGALQQLTAGMDLPVNDIGQARTTMSGRVAAARAAARAHRGAFLVMSGALGEALATCPGVSLRRLRYEQGVVELEVEAASLIELEGFGRALDALPGMAARLSGVIASTRRHAQGRVSVAVAGR